MAEPLLELEDVTARYGPVSALHGISLRVEEGEAVAVLGANGAGKTTTLRAISGTVKRSGRIAFAGQSIARRSPESVARAGIAHVPLGPMHYLQKLYYDTAISTSDLNLAALRRFVPTSQIVYGSDSPVIEATPPLDAIQTLGKEAVDAICSRNALALLV